MSTTIDQRVVEMQFDNKQFERNVQTSMSTLDKLKQSLNLTGASKGLDNVGTAAKRIDLSGLSVAAEHVGVKFNAMWTIADQTFRNITNAVERTAINMAKSLTIDPVKTGLAEYETQINAVQTILANTQSKGTNIDQVNTALDELNTYADKTIYNFTEMTRNIGTFTAAGVDLDKSVQSIKGIANLAAASGSSSQQASTAMYQLSQALAAGKVSLMDWNSVVNAGMGGELFQNALIRTSELLGTGAKAAIDTYGTFRESLTKGEWLTTEVLTETLAQISGAYDKADLLSQGYTEEQANEIMQLAKTAEEAATKVKTATQLIDTLKESAQSGWTQTWEYIIGDFEQAKELWTGISDTLGEMINASSESRNEVVKGAMLSNWDQMIEKVNEAGVETTTFEEKLKNVLKDNGYKDNLDEIIKKHGSLEKAFQKGAIESKWLQKAVDELNGSMVDLSSIQDEVSKGETGEDVKKIQEALKSLNYDIGETGVDGIFGGKTEAAVKAFQELNGLEVTGIIDEKTIEALEKASTNASGLSESCKGLIDDITNLGGREKLIESFKNIFVQLENVIKPIKTAFRQIFPKTTAEDVTSLIDKFHNFTSKLRVSRETAEKIRTTFKGFFSVIAIGVDAVKAIGGGIIKLLGNFQGLGGGILNVASSFGEWLSGLRESINETDLFGVAVDKIVGFVSLVITKIKSFGTAMKESFTSTGFEDFLGFFKCLWNTIKLIGSKISEVFSSIGSGISSAFEGDSTMANVADTGLFAAILIGIQKFVSKFMDMFDNVGGIAENVAGIFDDVRGCFEAYQTQLKAGALLKIAAAIAILAASIFVVSKIDADALNRSLGAIGVMFGELLAAMGIFTKISTNMKGTMKASALMISMSLSVLILASALKKLSSIDSNGLAKGLVAIGVLMAEISIFLRTAKFDKKMTSTAVGIVILSSAMLILAKAVEDFGAMKWQTIGKGLAAIGGLLLEIGLFTKLTGNAKHMMSTGAGLVLIAASMKIFASSMKEFANMKWEDIGKGLAGIGGSLLAVGIAVRLMPKNMLSIGIGLTAVGGALIILSNALTTFSGMSWEEIGRGLAAFGGSLGILAIGLNLMNGTLAGSAALLIAAGAIAILTPVLESLGKMSLKSMGKSLLVLAGAFAVLGVAGLVLGPIVPTILGLAASFALISLSSLALGAGLLAIAAGITAIAAAGAAGATAVVAAITVIINGVIDLIPTIISKSGEIILALCQVIIDCAPKLAETILVVITEVLKSLATYTPQILESLFQFLLSLLNGLADYIPDLIVAATNVIGAFFKGVVDALSGLDTESLFKGIIGIGLMSGLMIALSAVAGLVPGAMIGVLGMGAVVAEMAILLAAIGALAQIPGLEWLVSEGGNFLQTIGNAIGQFAGGIIGGFAEGVSASFPQIGTDLSNFMTNAQGFLDGAKGIDATTLEGVKSLVDIILTLSGASILESIASWLTGSSSLTAFGEQLVPFGEALASFSATISGKIDEGAVTAAANAGSVMAAMAAEIPNEGGLLSWIVGENNMETFGTQLVSFGESLASFSATVSGKIDENAATAAANAGSIMAAMATEIPNTGGILGWIMGDNDMDTFGTQMVAFGESLVSFCETVSGNIDESAVTAAANAGLMMASLDGAIPSDKWFDGKVSMDDFGSKIVSFGESLVDFSDTVADVSVDAVSKSITQALRIVTLANKISELDSTGIYTFDTVAISIADTIWSYNDKVKDIDTTTVTTSVSIANRLKTFVNSLTDIDTSGVEKFKIGSIGKTLKSYSNSVAEMDTTTVSASISVANRLKNFINSLANIDTSGVGSFKTAIYNLSTISVGDISKSFGGAASKLVEIGGNLMTSLSRGMKAKEGSISQTASSVAIKAYSAVVKKAEIYKAAGVKLMNALIVGLKGKASAIPTTINTIVSTAALKINSKYMAFYNAGKFLGSGLVLGINAKQQSVYDAAYKLGQKAVQGEKDGQQSKSPSKATIKAGKWFGEGLIIGIDSMGKKVYDTAHGIGETAVSSMSSAIARVSEAVNTNIDSQPTIRPVLDLSDVEAGAGLINGMFGTGLNLGVSTAAAGNVAGFMNNRIQNGTTNDVIAELNKLRKDLGNVGGNHYSINGITYDDGSNVATAVNALIRAAKIDRRT